MNYIQTTTGLPVIMKCVTDLLNSVKFGLGINLARSFLEAQLLWASSMWTLNKEWERDADEMQHALDKYNELCEIGTMRW